MSLNPNAVPSTNFDLSDWKLQLPIDVTGSFTGKAAEVKTLTDYVHGTYFYTGSDGAMVLAAPVEGATTGGSIYARSELREMNGTANAEWNLELGGQLSATLQVDAAPRHTDGSYGKVVVGQVHGGNGQLVRLAWEDGTLFFANDITSNGTKDVHIELRNSLGQQPSVSLNETFSYKIDVSADWLVVSVIADGQVYSSASTINDAWNDNSFYFKAGAYLGVNENNGSGFGQVSIFALDAVHGGDVQPPPIQPGCAIPLPSGPTPASLQQAALEIPLAEPVIAEPVIAEPPSAAGAGFVAIKDNFFLFDWHASGGPYDQAVPSNHQGDLIDSARKYFAAPTREFESKEWLVAPRFAEEAPVFAADLLPERIHYSEIDMQPEGDCITKFSINSGGFDLV